MELLIVVLRFVHVVGSMLWVGFAVFVPFYLAPAVAESGPDGGKVMAALQRRGIMNVLPVLAVATLVSGFWLYWIRSGGLKAAYVAAPAGIAFGAGGLIALVAFVLGMSVARPSMMRAAALMQSLQSLSPEERPQQMASIAELRARGARFGLVVAVLLLLAATCMAIARYL